MQVKAQKQERGKWQYETITLNKRHSKLKFGTLKCLPIFSQIVTNHI